MRSSALSVGLFAMASAQLELELLKPVATLNLDNVVLTFNGAGQFDSSLEYYFCPRDSVCDTSKTGCSGALFDFDIATAVANFSSTDKTQYGLPYVLREIDVANSEASCKQAVSIVVTDLHVGYDDFQYYNTSGTTLNELFAVNGEDMTVTLAPGSSSFYRFLFGSEYTPGGAPDIVPVVPVDPTDTPTSSPTEAPTVDPNICVAELSVNITTTTNVQQSIQQTEIYSSLWFNEWITVFYDTAGVTVGTLESPGNCQQGGVSYACPDYTISNISPFKYHYTFTVGASCVNSLVGQEAAMIAAFTAQAKLIGVDTVIGADAVATLQGGPVMASRRLLSVDYSASRKLLGLPLPTDSRALSLGDVIWWQFGTACDAGAIQASCGYATATTSSTYLIPDGYNDDKNIPATFKFTLDAPVGIYTLCISRALDQGRVDFLTPVTFVMTGLTGAPANVLATAGGTSFTVTLDADFSSRYNKLSLVASTSIESCYDTSALTPLSYSGGSMTFNAVDISSAATYIICADKDGGFPKTQVPFALNVNEVEVWLSSYPVNIVTDNPMMSSTFVKDPIQPMAGADLWWALIADDCSDIAYATKSIRCNTDDCAPPSVDTYPSGSQLQLCASWGYWSQPLEFSTPVLGIVVGYMELPSFSALTNGTRYNSLGSIVLKKRPQRLCYEKFILVPETKVFYVEDGTACAFADAVNFDAPDEGVQIWTTHGNKQCLVFDWGFGVTGILNMCVLPPGGIIMRAPNGDIETDKLRIGILHGGITSDPKDGSQYKLILSDSGLTPSGPDVLKLRNFGTPCGTVPTPDATLTVLMLSGNNNAQATVLASFPKQRPLDPHFYLCKNGIAYKDVVLVQTNILSLGSVRVDSTMAEVTLFKLRSSNLVAGTDKLYLSDEVYNCKFPELQTHLFGNTSNNGVTTLIDQQVDVTGLDMAEYTFCVNRGGVDENFFNIGNDQRWSGLLVYTGDMTYSNYFPTTTTSTVTFGGDIAQFTVLDPILSQGVQFQFTLIHESKTNECRFGTSSLSTVPTYVSSTVDWSSSNAQNGLVVTMNGLVGGRYYACLTNAGRTLPADPFDIGYGYIIDDWFIDIAMFDTSLCPGGALTPSVFPAQNVDNSLQKVDINCYDDQINGFYFELDGCNPNGPVNQTTQTLSAFDALNTGYNFSVFKARVCVELCLSNIANFRFSSNQYICIEDVIVNASALGDPHVRTADGQWVDFFGDVGLYSLFAGSEISANAKFSIAARDNFLIWHPRVMKAGTMMEEVAVSVMGSGATVRLGVYGGGLLSISDPLAKTEFLTANEERTLTMGDVTVEWKACTENCDVEMPWGVHSRSRVMSVKGKTESLTFFVTESGGYRFIDADLSVPLSGKNAGLLSDAARHPANFVDALAQGHEAMYLVSDEQQLKLSA